MSSPNQYIENDHAPLQVNEPQADYEKAELDLIRNALKRSHSERFQTMMSLIKTSIMLRNAKITHQSDK
ncbi:MAG: hypothetical protein H7Y86_20475 [Rhizobacter sp.]|nr:hypothetical protein [Ferruginibacter sp.]